MRTPTQKRKTVSEMQLARGRLRGALSETLQGSEEEDNDDYSAEETNSNGNNRPQDVMEEPVQPHRGRPPKIRRDSGSLLQSPRSSRQSSVSPSKKLTPAKRRRREEELVLQQLQRIQAESFVMKLFDRSLDLSKYTECTELYPICRAWMANQPRNPNIHSSKRRSPSPQERENNGIELLTKLKRGEIREITALPMAEEASFPKIPQMEDDTKVEEEEAGADDQIVNKLHNASKEELLSCHLGKWKRVKTNWVKHTKRYQQRYELNHMIIQELFKP